VVSHAGDLGQGFQPAGIQRIQAAPEHLLDQLLLGPEVVIDRGQIDAGGGGQLAQRGAIETALGKQDFGGAQYAFLGRAGAVHSCDNHPSLRQAGSNDRLSIRGQLCQPSNIVCCKGRFFAYELESVKLS
jgi:hypothetical protein